MPKDLNQFFLETQGISPEAAGLGLAAMERMSIGKLLPVKQIQALNYGYNKETSLGGVARRRINQNFPAVQGSTVSPVSEPIAIIGRVPEIDVRMDKADPRARANEHARAARAIGIEVDDMIFNGDRSKSDTDIDGLIARCTGKQRIVAATNGAFLLMDHVHAMLDAVEDVGGGRHVFWNKRLHRSFKSLVIDAAGGATVADVSGEIIKYEGVEFHPVGNGLDGKPLLDFDEKTGNDTETTSAYCVAFSGGNVELAGVRLLMASNSVEIIANGTEGSFIKDQVEFAFGLAVFDSTSVSRLSGIKKPL